MKSHIWLLQALLHDCAVQCSVHPREIARDLRTIFRRVESEGLSFLTITLPELSKSFLRGLREGSWPTASVTSFRHSGGLPLFLRGFLSQIFDTDGRLLSEPSISAINAVHQILLTFKKVEGACSEQRVKRVLADYVEVDRNIPSEPKSLIVEVDGLKKTINLSTVVDVFRIIFGPTFVGVENDLYEGKPIDAKHGPGATAERLSSNEKWRNLEWHERFDAWFHHDHYLAAFAGRGLVGDAIHPFVDSVPIPQEQERPVRVITVPKTMKGPRVIAIEPSLMQYMQQGLLKALTKGIEEDPLVREFLPLSDQSRNGSLALSGSIDGSLATIDLSEASDRVPLWLVTNLFSGFPHLRGGLLATRSSHAQVPGHGVIRLQKFASMGSATCFPVESIVFLTLALLGCTIADRRPLTRSSLRFYVGKVSVFGDDIIVPSHCTSVVASVLKSVGLKVNEAKTFATGRFRESCGVDAFAGHVITPAYAKTFDWDNSRLDWIAKWVSFSNRLYDMGFWMTARAIREKLTKVNVIPVVARSSPAIGFHHVRGTYEVHSWDKALQKFSVKALTYRTKKVGDPLDGTAALVKCLSTPLNEDPEHLNLTVRSASVSTKRRWTSPY